MATDDVLVKLVIRGMDPAEVHRLAESTGGQLAAEMGKHFQKLTELHKLSNQLQDADTKKRVQSEIREEGKKLEAVTKVYKEMEREATRAANASRNAWRRTMEDLENFTTVAMGAIGIWDRITGSAKRFADEVIRVSQVMRSQGGGPSAFSISNEVGDISALDVAAARNKAFLQELNLTESEFTNLAKAASSMGDAMGTDATQGLNTLLDAMATGRTRALAAIGVVINQKEAYEKYATALGTTTEALDDNQKKEALQKEILAKTQERVAALGTAQEDLSDVMEKALTRSSNAWTKFLQGIGENKFLGKALTAVGGFVGALDQTIGESMGIYKRNLGARQSITDTSQLPGSMDTVAAIRAADMAAERSAMFADLYGTERRVTTVQEDRIAEARKKRKKRRERDGRGSGLSLSDQLAISSSMGDDGDEFGGLGRAQEAIFAGTDVSDMPMDDGTGGGFTQELASRLEAYKKGLEEVRQKAGGGIMAAMLFGPDGPDRLYEEMDTFQKASVDAMGMVSEAGMRMADALGQSIAASIAGSNGHRKSMRDMTHDVLVSLSAQAISRAIFETAEGFSKLSNPFTAPFAAMNFKSAALFASIGVGSGLAARAVGQDAPPATSGIGSSSSAGSGGFGSGFRSANDNGGSRANIVINVGGAIPGTEAEVGRAVWKALSAHAKESGVQMDQAIAGT